MSNERGTLTDFSMSNPDRSVLWHLALARTVAIVALAWQLIAAGIASPSPLPEIWFSPPSADDRSGDLASLFTPNAPWQEAASHIRVFEISGGTARRATEVQLRSMMSDLTSRQIALALGMSPLTGDGRCGKGIEGYNAANQPVYDARRLQANGGTAAYITMDEPLYYGHVFSGQGACHSSISAIAGEVANKIRQVHAVFPQASVGDIEPVGVDNNSWLQDLEEWVSAYRAATGEELAFFRADIQWHTDWDRQLRPLAHLLRQHGIVLQVIYNGNARSDREWVDEAAQRFTDYESGDRSLPNVAVFQCWTSNPTHLLPESDPQTFTGLVKRYIHWRESRSVH